MDYPREEPKEPLVVYEDECLVAVAKPARMHSAPGLGGGGLCAWVFERYPEVEGVGRGAADAGGAGGREGGLLHRLDFETSGLVLFARTGAAYASLLEQQVRGGFVKEYRACCAPSREASPSGSRPAKACPEGPSAQAWSEARETLDGPALAALLRETLAEGSSREGASPSCAIVSAFRPFGPKGARVACLEPREGGMERVYRSELLSCLWREGGRLELLLSLSRGFRHQLRAQLAWIGLPICGDPLYGGFPDDRLRLYAERLRFAHPASRSTMLLSLGDSSAEHCF